MADDNVVAFKRPAEEPEPDCRFTDEDGIVWSKFGLEYAYDGSRWACEIWAKNWEDAEAKVMAMRSSLVVVGEKFADIEAEGDLTVDALVNAGAHTEPVSDNHVQEQD